LPRRPARRPAAWFDPWTDLRTTQVADNLGNPDRSSLDCRYGRENVICWPRCSRSLSRWRVSPRFSAPCENNGGTRVWRRRPSPSCASSWRCWRQRWSRPAIRRRWSSQARYGSAGKVRWTDHRPAAAPSGTRAPPGCGRPGRNASEHMGWVRPRQPAGSLRAGRNARGFPHRYSVSYEFLARPDVRKLNAAGLPHPNLKSSWIHVPWIRRVRPAPDPPASRVGQRPARC